MEGNAVIVLDTHVIIWNALKPELLSREAKKEIARANNADGTIFCEISLWEIAMLIQKDRLRIETSYLNFVKLLKAANKYVFKGITPEIAELSTKLPAEINDDPADRIISATAIVEKSTLITADRNLRKARIIKTAW